MDIWKLIEEVVPEQKAFREEVRQVDHDYPLGWEDLPWRSAHRYRKPIPQEEEPEREIFISYAWGGESESIADQLDKVFQEKGITIIRDKRDLEFKGRIKSLL